MGKNLLYLSPLLSLLSCGKTVTKVETKTVTNTENIFICCLQSGSSSAELIAGSIQPSASSKVMLNSHYFPFKEVEPGKVVFNDTSTIDPSAVDTVELISSQLGNASGTVTMPDSTYIIVPAAGDTFPIGNGINVKWAKISGAKFYEVAYEAGAKDKAGNLTGNLLPQYKFISDTSFAIPDSYFNSPDTNTTWYDVSISLSTYAGADIQPNSPSNMSSNTIKGFLYACGKATTVKCFYGIPQNKGKARSNPVVIKKSGLDDVIDVFENIQKN